MVIRGLLRAQIQRNNKYFLLARPQCHHHGDYHTWYMNNDIS